MPAVRDTRGEPKHGGARLALSAGGLPTPLTATARPVLGIAIKRRAGLLASGALLALALSAAMSTSARAGTYAINDCPAAPVPNGDSGPWIAFGAPQGSKGSCGGGAGDWIGPRGASMSPGSLDGVQVAVPAGSAITIREAKVWWYVPQQSSGGTTYALAADNDGAVGESEAPLDQRGTPSVFLLGSNTTVLTLADYCANDDAGEGCNFGASVNPNLLLYGSQLTLAESQPPNGSVSGGGLLGTGALSGTRALSFNASDADSGVRAARLLIDGRDVAGDDYLARCPYTNFQACPGSESDSISWNTATVPDGQHTLALQIEDAAQNTSIAYSTTITIQNAASSPGTTLAPIGAGALSPSASSPPETHATSTSSPGPAPQPSAPSPLAAPASAALGAHLLINGASTLRRSFADRALSVSGRLMGTAQSPIAGATLDVLSQGADGGAISLIARALTRADGSFFVHVPAGPSRLLRIAYRPSLEEAGYSAQALLHERVAAGVALQVTPRRTSPAGTITLAGQVAGPLPRQGVVVELLVHYRGQWEPFRTPRTGPSGRFSVPYQFQGALGRFPFRAEVLGGQSGFAYATGASAPVEVSTG